MASELALLFLRGTVPPDYGGRLARLRWRRAFASDTTAEAAPQELASETFSQAQRWLVVREENALPLPGAALREPGPGRVLVALGVTPSPPPIHTVRELEENARALAPVAPDRTGPVAAPALFFRVADLPPDAGETVGAYIARLAGPATPRESHPRFAALALPDPYAHVRPEVTRHLPEGMRRLLDVGCGAGAASGAVKDRVPELVVIGIERDAGAAERARGRLDRVHCGDAAEVLGQLLHGAERFDAFLFADVLEHLEDPIGALTLAHRLAAAGATLVASVPNAGHLSLVRDLMLGRFDPVPAGLADAGHLRWFTKRSLAEFLEEAGWRPLSIEPIPGAPAPDAEEFLSFFDGWGGADLKSLSTYQWLAVATAMESDLHEL